MSQSQESTARGEPAGGAGGASRIDRGQATSVEIDAEVAAALGYLFSYVAAVVVLAADEENEFVRFHVFQSLAYNLLVGVAMIGLFVVGTVLASVAGFAVFLLVGPVFALAAVPNGGGAAGGAAVVALTVVLTLFVFGVSFVVVLLLLLPLVLTIPVLGYLAFVAYRASHGERYEMPYIADFVEQYV